MAYTFTKRKILLAISNLFDSLGLIGSVLIVANICMDFGKSRWIELI